MNLVTVKTVTTPSGSIIGTKTVTGELGVDLSIPLTSEQADKEVDVVIDVSTVTGLVMICDRACTVKVNSTGAPAATITLVANEAIALTGGTEEITAATLLGADVTKLYLTNGYAGAATFRLYALSDPTP